MKGKRKGKRKKKKRKGKGRRVQIEGKKRKKKEKNPTRVKLEIKTYILNRRGGGSAPKAAGFLHISAPVGAPVLKKNREKK